MHKEERTLWFHGGSALLSFNSHNSGNFHPNEKSKISESKLGSPLFDIKKHFRNETKDFCSIVDQTQDIFFGTPSTLTSIKSG